MNKLEKIVQVLDILNNEQMMELSNIQIVDEKKTPNEFVFSLLLLTPFEPETYHKIKNIKHEDLKISTKVVAVKNVEHIDVKKYILYYLAQHPDLNLFKLGVVQDRFEFDIGSRIITFKYSVESEREQINYALKDIIDLLKGALGLSTLDFEIIEDDDFKQKLEERQLRINKEKEEVKKASEKKEEVKQATAHTKENPVDIKKIIPLAGLMDGMNNVNVCGEVYLIDVKETPKVKSTKVYLNDYDSAFVLKYNIFPEGSNAYNQKNIEPILGELKKGQWVSATIDVKTDQYEKEPYGAIKKINVIDKPSKFIRNDNANLKRIELCNHSKMSAYDGITEAEDIVKTAKQFGMDAIALTDRFNIQSFPLFQKACDKQAIKPIYGVEMCVLPPTKIVLNETMQDLTKMTYVVFDLETTGLFPAVDDIIEFGGIKYVNGIMTESLQFFIKPNQPLKDVTIQLTNITNDLVENAISQEEGIKKILSFIGDSVLIAHNAINFDYRFLCCKAEKLLGIQLSNPVIDTLHIVRAMYPGWQGHTLQKTCKEFKVSYGVDKAHRADYDADVLNRCWTKLMKEMAELGITKVNDINSKLDSPRLKANYQSNYTFIYPKNSEGLSKLNELVSISHTTNYFTQPKIFYETLDFNRSNLLVCPSPIEGEVTYAALNGTNAELKKVISKYDYIFVASPNNFLPYISNGDLTKEQVEAILKKIITYSIEQGKKVIAVSDSYYLNQWDKKYQEVYLYCKGLNGRRHRYYRYKCLPDQHLRTTHEMVDEFRFLNDEEMLKNIVISNSREFADQISGDIRPIKDGLFAPKMDNVDENMKEVVYRTAKEKYGENLPKEVTERLEKELNSIIGHGFSVVYWISHLLVKKSYDDGYTVGSRGSVGSSLVATMLKITDVNPLPPHYICSKCKHCEFTNVADDGFDLLPTKCPHCDGIMYGEGHDIPFETFLGFHGDKVPDIDLNFSGVYQPNAHNFIKEQFGEMNAFRAGTIATVAEKTCFALVREYFEEIAEPEVKMSLIQLYATKCQDVKRTTGQHPGGIIIIPKEYSVYDFTPYNYPADDTTSDWFTTHYAFEYIHDNVLKFDILGHDNPTILKMLRDLTGIDESEVPNTDPNVMKAFCSPEPLKLLYPDFVKFKNGAITIPEFGTKFVREMLDDTQPQTFSDLVRISGLSHGTDVYLGNAKDLIKKQGMKLKDVIACRDDIMIYLINKGLEPSTAFKIMEDVRKGKKLKPEYMEVMEKNSVPNWYIDSCNKIQYMFPKAHATAYCMHAWKFMWYKLYYPLQYYSVFLSIKSDSLDIDTVSKGKESIKGKIDSINSLLNNKATAAEVKKKDIDSLTILDVCLEMACRGIKIHKPDIYLSDATTYTIHNNEIYAPFNCIEGLGNDVAQGVIDARNEKPFTSIDDVTNRTKLNKTVMQKLKDLGVFDTLPESGQISLFDI